MIDIGIRGLLRGRIKRWKKEKAETGKIYKEAYQKEKAKFEAEKKVRRVSEIQERAKEAARGGGGLGKIISSIQIEGKHGKAPEFDFLGIGGGKRSDAIGSFGGGKRSDAIGSFGGGFDPIGSFGKKRKKGFDPIFG